MDQHTVDALVRVYCDYGATQHERRSAILKAQDLIIRCGFQSNAHRYRVAVPSVYHQYLLLETCREMFPRLIVYKVYEEDHLVDLWLYEFEWEHIKVEMFENTQELETRLSQAADTTLRSRRERRLAWSDLPSDGD